MLSERYMRWQGSLYRMSCRISCYSSTTCIDKAIHRKVFRHQLWTDCIACSSPSLTMEPIVIIAILILLGRGRKEEKPVTAPSRGISPSVTPPLTTQSGYQTPQTTNATMISTTTTITPTFTDAGGMTETRGEFGSRSQGIAAVGRLGGSAPVRKFTEEKAVRNAPGEYGSRSRGISVVGRRGGSGVVDKSAMVRPPSAPPSPVYRTPTPPRVAPQAPPTIPSQSGAPIMPAPKTVDPVQRESPSLRDTIASGGIPDFCRKEYMPFLMQPCPGTSVEPALRQGPPPPGTWVVTGPLVPGAQRSRANPSCPDASPRQDGTFAGREGIYYMIAGSDEWNAICPPSATVSDI